jgi:hypothetical protein
MRKSILLTLIIPLIFISGCLTYSTVKYQLEFNEDLSGGTIKVLFLDIKSTEVDTEKQRKDFIGAVELLFEDDFLLDNIEEGIYIKKRDMYVENGKLNISYSGIFRSSKLAEKDMKITENERILRFDKNKGDVATSNGNVVETEDSFIFSWPKDLKNPEFEIKRKMEDSYSLLDYYNEWKRKQ